MNWMKMELKKLLCLAALLITGLAWAGSNDLSHGHQVLLDKGLQIQAQVFPVVEDTGQVVGFDLNRWVQSNFTTINFQWNENAVNTYLGAPGSDLQWARWLHWDLKSHELPYLSQCVGLQIGDEQKLVSGQMGTVTNLVNVYSSHYPNQIVYTNQSPLYNGEAVTVSLLQEYMTAAKPGMLCFTEYPFRFKDMGGYRDYEGGSPTLMYEHMEVYRSASLLGNDGSGNKPIPFGLYTEAFIDNRAGLNHRSPSESQVRLEQFAAWAFGAKQVSAFVYTDPLASTVWNAALFNGLGDSSPTSLFYQHAELNRQSRNLGDALVRLISTGVSMKMGKHGSGTTNELPSGVSAWDSTSDEHLKNISATNLGSKNGGLEGDVIVGFFKPLDESLVAAGSENDTYFMILNGLSDEYGTAADCRQEITLEFDFTGTDITQLLRVSRDTGEVEVVDLLLGQNGMYSLTFILDGGTGDLFKYDTGTSFVPEPATCGIMLIGGLAALIRKRR